MSSQPSKPDLESYLPRFRLSTFRPGQKDVIAAVLAGEDCLCVMPTGGGKSLCYQLPAMVHDGLTLVVSPLIALMKDQVDQLQVLGLPATFINSTLSMAEQYDRLEKMAALEYRLVYVVPERFRSARFLEAIRAAGVKLLAVDEAHCISEWGHDFRPDYARLGQFRRQLGYPTTIALTATATDAVRRDVIEQLSLREPRTFITGFARPNLFYEVRFPRTEREKADRLIRFLRATPGSGIVYASTRKKTEEVAAMIAGKLRRSTVAYHAGLLPEERRKAQETFMSGRTEIVAATTAFGMGIDKADVRFVVHYNLPGSLEAYYQEAGRAGRDGEPSRCLMLYNAADRWIQEFFIESAYPAREVVAQVYECLKGLRNDPIELTQQEIKERLSLGIGAEGVGACEQLLESAGVLERLIASENRAAVRLDTDLVTLVDLLPKQAKVRRRVLQAVERIVGPRRHEVVHFHPRDLARGGDMDQASLAHALRELNGLDAFTYVPPFRGRAIRMIDRDRSFGELDIDFDTLEQRKAAEYKKLNQVAHFANSPRCRQGEILRYFGDPSDAQCGHCDNCLQTQPALDQTQHPTETVDEKLQEAVRMALSGVARAQIRLSVSCGKILIAQMLCGSNSARVTKLGLDQLSTFGLLAHLTQPEVASLLDALIITGHLEQTEYEPRRPIVRLTELGSDVMKGNADLEVVPPIPPDLIAKIRGDRLPPRPPSDSRPDEGPLPPADTDLFAVLRKWRNETASQSMLPPYRVLSNATLEELARRQPDSPEALLEVKGIGPAKLEQYGSELLALLTKTGSHETAPEDVTKAPEARDGPPLSDAWEEAEPGVPEPFSFGPLDEPPSHHEPSLEAPGPNPDAAAGHGQTLEPTDTTHTPHQDAPSSPTQSVAAGPRGGDVKPNHYWTWRLLSDGFSIEECEAIRGIQRETIVGHLLRALEDGWEVRAEWCLPASLIRALEAVVGSQRPTEIRPLLAKLPAGASHAEVQLFLKCRSGPSQG